MRYYRKADIGDKFGRWTVIGIAGRFGTEARIHYAVRCLCGNEGQVSTHNLFSGHSQSCGCLVREKISAATTKHGFSDHPLYSTWNNMHRRCSIPSEPAFKDYGSRGIAVCERWNDIAAFVADMGERPTPEHSLDRIDNDKGYSPDNCRWATDTEQQSNRRAFKPFKRTLEITAFGESLPIGEWARRTGIGYNTIFYRLKLGWPAEQILTKQPTPNGR